MIELFHEIRKRNIKRPKDVEVIEPELRKQTNASSISAKVFWFSYNDCATFFLMIFLEAVTQGEKFRNFHRKTPVLESLLKRDYKLSVFSYEICEVFKNTSFKKYLWTTAFLFRTCSQFYRFGWVITKIDKFITRSKLFEFLINFPADMDASQMHLWDVSCSVSETSQRGLICKSLRRLPGDWLKTSPLLPGIFIQEKNLSRPNVLSVFPLGFADSIISKILTFSIHYPVLGDLPERLSNFYTDCGNSKKRLFKR